MEFTIQNFFFWAYTILAFSMAQYAATLALTNRQHLGGRQFLAIAFTALLLLPAFAATALGSLPGWGPLLALSPLLPVLCIMAIWSNIKTLKQSSAGLMLLLVPISIWNLLLTVLYVLRVGVTLGGFDLGHSMSSLLTGFAMVQRNIGGQDAELLPLYLYMPLLVPPFVSASGLRLGINGVSGLLAAGFCTLFLAVLPRSFALNLMLRKESSNQEVALREDLALSMRLSLDGKGLRRRLPKGLDILGNSSELALRIQKAKGLGLSALELPISADTIGSPKDIERLKAVAKEIREAGLSLIVSVREARAWRGVHRLHPKAYQKAMMDAHWILSEHLAPDLLILYVRPFSERSKELLGNPDVARWKSMIEESLTVLRKAHPDLQVGMDLELPSDETQALYQALNSSSSAVDQIRFVIAGDRAHSTAVVRSLLSLGGWLASHPPQKDLSLVLEAPSPLGLGGALAQDASVRRVFSYGTRHALFRSLSLGKMFDSSQGLNGYYDSRARPRMAERSLVKMLEQMRGVNSTPVK